MKTTLAALLGATMLTAPAPTKAADVHGSMKDPIDQVSVSPRVHWTGLAIGVFGGYGWGDADVTRNVAHSKGRIHQSYCDLPTVEAPTDVSTKGLISPEDKRGLSKADCEAAKGEWKEPYHSPEGFADGRFDHFYKFDNDKSHHSLDMDGWFGGADVSYKLRRDSLIVEPFADVSIGGGKGSTSFARDVVFQDEDGNDTGYTAVEAGGFSMKKKLGATVGLKVGALASENDYIYALAGLAYGRFDIKGGSDLDNDNFPVSSYDETASGFGYTLGAGYERAISSNWKLGIEGRYTDITDISASFSGQSDSESGRKTYLTSESVDADYGEWSVRGRVTYTFGN